MLRTINGAQGESFAHDPAGRGYCVMYRENQVNHCPGCGRTHWLIGRFSAECGFCSTALPLAEATSWGVGTHNRNQRPMMLGEGVA